MLRAGRVSFLTPSFANPRFERLLS